MRTHEEKYYMRYYTDSCKGYEHENSNNGQPLPLYFTKDEGRDASLLNLVISMFEGNIVNTPSSGLNNVSDLLN